VNNKKCDPSGLDGMTICERCRAQRFELASVTLYVGYFRCLICIDDATFMRNRVRCALYWIRVVTYTIFGHLRQINLQSKKKISISLKLSLQVQFLSFAIPFLRPVVSEKQWDGQRGALPLHGTGVVTVVWKHQLPTGRVAVVAVCVRRQ